MSTNQDKELYDMLGRAGGFDENNNNISLVEMDMAQMGVAQAIQEPLRDAILNGDIVSPFYTKMRLGPNESPEFALDLISPGEEGQFSAYTYPGNGYIPHRLVESDYVMIATYMIANSIDVLRRGIRNQRFDTVSRMTEILEAGFVQKMNDDGMKTILAAATDRNILVYDADASVGQFTKRLISLGKTVMKRNGGGNSASVTRSELTDLITSIEAVEDVRNWTVDQLDDFSRREVYVASDDSSALLRVFGVNLHPMYEFGEGQVYQNYWINQLGGSFGASGKVEILVGINGKRKGNFVMPIRQEVTIYNDPNQHRHGKFSLYGEAEIGFGVLDGRDTILLAY